MYGTFNQNDLKVILQYMYKDIFIIKLKLSCLKLKGMFSLRKDVLLK